jgi:hypothetical protein
MNLSLKELDGFKDCIHVAAQDWAKWMGQGFILFRWLLNLKEEVEN